MNARILLKGRPTSAQLADRLRPPLPEGMELYLDLADISGDGWLERLADLLAAHPVPPEFAWVVEGPLRSLDGAYFDVARAAEADRQLLARLVAAARRVGAPAVVIHAMALAPSAEGLNARNREVALARVEAFFTHYVALCQAHGLVPTVENVPPVARMREAAFAYPLLGMSAADIARFCDRVPGLRATCDTSHAQLYLNAAHADPSTEPAALAPVARFVGSLPHESDLITYVQALGPRIYEAHVSNAAGILDEGLPYEVGDLDLDTAVTQLLRWATYLVTEPIEPRPERADYMRAMAGRLRSVRERAVAGGRS
ncbi:MAG: sugar phosphate isomerase/epimerase family protein [Chloroflexota bacterium]